MEERNPPGPGGDGAGFESGSADAVKQVNPLISGSSESECDRSPRDVDSCSPAGGAENRCC